MFPMAGTAARGARLDNARSSADLAYRDFHVGDPTGCRGVARSKGSALWGFWLATTASMQPAPLVTWSTSVCPPSSASARRGGSESVASILQSERIVAIASANPAAASVAPERTASLVENGADADPTMPPRLRASRRTSSSGVVAPEPAPPSVRSFSFARPRPRGNASRGRFSDALKCVACRRRPGGALRGSLLPRSRTRGRPPALGSIVPRLLELKPSVVVVVGEYDFTSSLFQPHESRWPRTEKVRPHYVSVAYNRNAGFFRFLGKDRALDRRFIGVGPPSTSPASTSFGARFNEAFSEHVTAATSPAATYDAMYWLLSAASTLGDEPITGPRLAAALETIGGSGQPARDRRRPGPPHGRDRRAPRGREGPSARGDGDPSRVRSRDGGSAGKRGREVRAHG